MTSWLRLWHDMPTDPKWRLIANRSDQSIGLVIAVYNFLLVSASCNTVKRGVTQGFVSEDVACALGENTEVIDSILRAMDGKVLSKDGIEYGLTGWEKRQPKREDKSTDRVREFRRKRNETQCNDAKRNETLDSDAESEKKDKNITPFIPLMKKRRRPKGELTFFVEEQSMPMAFAKVASKFPSLNAEQEWQACRDWYLKAAKGTGSVGATANTWCKKAIKFRAEENLKLNGRPLSDNEKEAYRGVI